MKLESAKIIADKIVSQLAPFCERICIGGSIRREAPQVGDIEIICIPRRSEGIAVEGFCEVVNQWHKVKGDPTGKMTQRTVNDEVFGMVQLDLFMCVPDNWGYIVAIRTGSADYSRGLASEWVRKGYKGDGGFLTKNGEKIILSEEEDLFRLLDRQYLHPKYRNA